MNAKIGLQSDELIKLIQVFCKTIEQHKESINALNVFPVPDGDTGTNMFFTLRGILDYIQENKKDLNLSKLILKIKNKLKNQFITSEDILITRERHRQNLKNCVQHLEKFQRKKSVQDFDKAAEDLRLATRHLGMIVGKVDVEELLGSIFNDFCIGK